MSRLDPFAYPTEPHVRKHAPAGYAEYQAYKPWLRDEFVFRCVYCLQREMWSRDRHAVFSVDHVVPQSEDPSLTCVYSNLVYACVRCNSARQDVTVIDPTVVGMGGHLAVGSDGVVRGLTEDGEFLVELLHLNAGRVVQERLRVFRIRDRYEANPSDTGVAADFSESFGFPDELPDLRGLRPPAGNSLEVNRRSCFAALQERRQLPCVY